MRERITEIRERLHSGVGNSTCFSAHVVKSCVFQPAASPLPNIITLDQPNDLERQYNSYATFQRKVPSLGFYFLTDATLRRKGLILRKEMLLDAPDLIPAYVRNVIEQDPTELASRPEVVTVADPVLILPSEAHLVYGHWLLDILPRAWLYTTAFGERVPDLKLVLPSDTPEFGRVFLENYFEMPRSATILHDVHNQDLLLKQAVVPSLLHVDHAFHPIFNVFLSHLLAHAAPRQSDARTNEWIYVSRHKFRDATTSYRRSIKNEEAVMTLVQEMGFRVVCPEDLSWPEQIAMFARAKIVIGESGSALHNTIFGDFGTVVLCIRPVNQVQASISAARRQQLLFFYPDEEEVTELGVQFTLDLARLSRAIQQCREMASASPPSDCT